MDQKHHNRPEGPKILVQLIKIIAPQGQRHRKIKLPCNYECIYIIGGAAGEQNLQYTVSSTAEASIRDSTQ